MGMVRRAFLGVIVLLFTGLTGNLETGTFLEEAREESSSGVPHSLDICGVEDGQFHSEINSHIP